MSKEQLNDMYEYDGQYYSESLLREGYPEDFDRLVADGVLKKKEEEPVVNQEESMYEYDGELYSESLLREGYPDQFDKLVADGVLIKKEGLGKGVAVEDVATQTAMDEQATGTDSVSENGFLASQEEDTLLERTFGKNTITDFFGDIYRAGVQGFLQAEAVDPSMDILKSGSDASAKEISEWIRVNDKIAKKSVESDEMKDFNKAFDENGGGAFGFLMGTLESPTVLTSLFVSSMATQIGSLASGEVLGAAAAGAGTGAGTGAALGLAGGVFAPITSAAGAATGALSGGIGAGAAAMEASLTFSELLQEKIDGKATPEKVRAILNDPEQLKDIRSKAIGRGVAIGAIEGLTGGLSKGAAGKVAKIVSKGKSITGRNVRKALIPLTGGAVEVAGGMAGEVAGRLAADQEMDVKEIGFEGFAGLGTAPLTFLPTTLKNINVVSGRVKATNEAKAGGYESVSSVFNPDTDIDKTTMDLAAKKNTSNIVDEQVEIEVANGRMDEERAEAIKTNFRETQGAVNTANKIDRLTDENKPEAVKLLIEEKRLKDKIKDVDNASLTKTESERLKEVQSRLEEISNPKDKKPSTETEKETGVPPTQEEQETVETAPAEEAIPQEYLEDLKKEVETKKREGNLLDSANKQEKVYLDGKEGNIKFESSIDPTNGKTIINENTIIFESGDEIIELGNKDEVGSEPIAGFGFTTMPPGGLDVQAETMDADVVSIDGKEYNVIGRSKDKKGKAVVKVKEVIRTTDKETGKPVIKSGLVRRIKGARAERVLKDVQLRKEKKDTPLPLTVEGKEVETPAAPTKKELRAKKVAEKRKAREEYDSKALEDLSKLEEEHQRAVQEFEEIALEEAANESKDKDLVQVGENVFQVTKNADGSFSVSQMNESGKLIGTREEAKRSKAIGVFKSKKSNQERRALAKAEKLIDEFKKEELQKIDDAIDEKLSARQQKSEGSKPAFNERIDAPESVVIAALQVIRNSYAAGRNILQAVDDALSFIEDQGFYPNDFYFKELVLDILSDSKPKETTKATPKTKVSPTETTNAAPKTERKPTVIEKVASKFGKSRMQSRVKKQVENAKKALSKVAPGVTIEVYETQEDFEAAGGNPISRGEYALRTKTIRINLEKANMTTVAHEVFHALLLKDGITNAKAQQITSNMIDSVRKVASPKLLKELDDFASNYENELQSEESMAQLFGILAENYESSPQSVKDLINDWLRKLAKVLNVPVEALLDSDKDGILSSDKKVLDFLDVVSAKVAKGEVVNQADIDVLQNQEQGSEGEVGTIKIPRRQIKVIDSPSVKDDPRSWIRKFVEYVDINEFDLKKFVTNMYDYTNAGKTDLGNGYSIELLGGRNYVPLIMHKMGKVLGDISNLAAFNTKSQAEGFIRNATKGKANLFAPHSGTLNGSWQFQQHIFEQLVDLVLDNNILSNKDIIKLFNVNLRNESAKKTYAKRIKSIEEKGYYIKKVDGKEVKVTKKPAKPSELLSAFRKFIKASGLDIKNLDSFESNPKELVRLLNIENNFSPDLRKNLNQKIAANKKFQKAIGVKSLQEFHQKIMDPLNKGIVGGEIMTFVQFDPTTFEIVKTNPGDVDHHPSFGWTVKAKIERIMQPTKFYKSYDITESYTKYNSEETVVSRKTDPDIDFKSVNVSSAAGAIVKVAEVKIPQIRQQKIDNALSKASGTTQVATTTGSYVKAAKILNSLEKEGEVLDYGAGLGLGTDAMSEVLGSKVDSYELNPERWKGKSPVTYTKSGDINKKYDAIVSLNVVNVVPKNIRDFILEDIYDKLKIGGVAAISSRAFKNDIANAKNFEKGAEDKSYIIKRKKGGETIDVYQKGFDGNEFVEYVQDLLGDKVNVYPNNTFGQRGVIIEKIGDDFPQTRQQKVFRAGDLVNKAEPIYKFELTRRSTGHFGTGFYFFGKKEDAQEYAKRTGTDTASRIVSVVDLDDYNLAPASLRLHNALKSINDSAMSNKPTSITTYDISTVSKILGVNSPNQISTENPYKEFAFRNNDQYVLLLKKYTEEEIDKGSSNYISFEQSQDEKRDIVANEINEKLKSSGNTDTPSTLIMKALGFEGVNATGTELDNSTYGTVVYDIKPQTRQQQSQEDFTIQDVIEESKKEGLTRKETIEVLQEVGFTKDEIRDGIKQFFKKEKPVTIASETKGLTEKQMFEQGFAEFFDSVKRDKKEAREKAAAKTKERIEKLRASFKARIDKMKDNDKARAAIVKEIKSMIKDSKLSKLSKSTIGKIITRVKLTNANNIQKMVDQVADALNMEIDRILRRQRYKDRGIAIKRIKNLGVLKELQPKLLSIFSVDPAYLSKRSLVKYDKIISDLVNVDKKYDSRMSREELSDMIDSILSDYSSDNQRANELKDRISNSMDPNLTIRKNLDKMLKDGIISKDDHELALRFLDIFNETNADEEMSNAGGKSKEEVLAEIKEEFLDAMNEPTPSILNITGDERSAVKFANSLTEKDFDSLTPQQARDLVRGLEMLKDGFVSTKLLQSKIRVEGNRDSQSVSKEIKERGAIDKLISKSKIFTKNLFLSKNKKETSISNRIRSTPLRNIDQVIKSASDKLKTTNIYKSILYPSSQAFSRLEASLKDIKTNLEKAEALLSIRKNTRFLQKVKVMMYQIQREYESNPKNKEVNTAKKWIEATLDDENSVYDEREKAAIRDLMNEFTVDGKVSTSKILEGMTSKEKRFLAIVDETYASIQEKAAADAANRGMTFIPRENYVHLPKVTNQETQMTKEFDDLHNSFTNPSLKSKAAIQRTGNVHSISLDPVHNAYTASRKTETSYYMYPIVKRAKIALSNLRSEATTKNDKELAKALEDVYDGIISYEFKNVTKDRAFSEKAISFLGRAGYLAQLAGPVKAAVELTTNAGHAMIVNPIEFISGIKTLSASGSNNAVIDAALKVLGSTQTARLTNQQDLSSKDIEDRLFSKSKLFEPEDMTSDIAEDAEIVRNVAKKPLDWFIKFNENLITKPDTLVARPLFVGAFNTSFKKETGVDVDWNKIATDTEYREKYASAIEKATFDADSAVIDNAASNNPFDGIPKNINPKDASAIKSAAIIMDRYMSRFRVFEYYSALKAVQSLVGKGDMSRTKGAMLLAGTVFRMSMYKMAMDMTFALIFMALGIDDDEDEFELGTDLTRNVLAGVATLALGRNIGNLSQIPINYGTEWLNKEYGEGITRTGEYDAYKNNLAFSKIPLDPSPRDDVFTNMVVSSLGSFTPMAKTIKRGVTLQSRASSAKTQETIDKNQNELLTRIPFEIAGNLGAVPAYKDIRKIYLKYLFQGVEKSKSSSRSSRDRDARLKTLKARK